VSQRSIQSEWVRQELDYASSVGAGFVPVLLETIDRALLPPSLSALHWFDGTRERDTAPQRLARHLLQLDRRDDGV
jgi:hypothetical protein